MRLRQRCHELLLGSLCAALFPACQGAQKPDPREIMTEVEALRAAPAIERWRPDAPALPSPALSREQEQEQQDVAVEAPASRCPDVQLQARDLGAGLPRRLDPDTLATSVSARGCDLVFEYELTTLDAKDVAADGMRAMSARVSDQLCSDRGALGVMQRGGRFTNVYYDRARVPIGLFTVTAEDCGI
jgi:hypothetical protein